MGTRKPKVDLSQLPLRYRRKNKKWWIDTKTQKIIHNSRITDYLPKEKVQTEAKTYWWHEM